MADGKGGGSKWCPSFLPYFLLNMCICQHSDEKASRNTMRCHTIFLLWIATGISLLQDYLLKMQIDVNFLMAIVYVFSAFFFCAASVRCENGEK